MNGKAVFDFTMKNVPQSLIKVMELARVKPEQIDFVVLHQANKSILTNIAARAGFKNSAKVPSKTLEKYGNLSVASIPSVFNDQLGLELSSSKKQILISGFGVGLAWGSAVLNLDKIYCPQPFKYQE